MNIERCVIVGSPVIKLLCTLPGVREKLSEVIASSLKEVKNDPAVQQSLEALQGSLKGTRTSAARQVDVCGEDNKILFKLFFSKTADHWLIRMEEGSETYFEELLVESNAN